MAEAMDALDSQAGTGSDIPPPPPGFEMEQDSSIPPPPPGFKMESDKSLPFTDDSGKLHTASSNQSDDEIWAQIQADKVKPPADGGRAFNDAIPTPRQTADPISQAQQPQRRWQPAFADVVGTPYTTPDRTTQAAVARSTSPRAAASAAAGMPLADVAGRPQEPQGEKYYDRGGIPQQSEAVFEQESDPLLSIPMRGVERYSGAASDVANTPLTPTGRYMVPVGSGRSSRVEYFTPKPGEPLPPGATPEYGSTEENRRRVMHGNAEMIQGIGEASTPLVVAGGVTGPLKTGAGLLAGYALSEGAGSAVHGHVSPEDEEFIRAVVTFLPSAAGTAFGLKTGSIETPEGKFSAASALGDRVKAGVARTPDVTSGRVRVGNTQFEVNIPRRTPMPEPSEAAKMLGEFHQSTGETPTPPAPAPPPQDTGPEHLTPEVAKAVSDTIMKAAPADRPKLMLEAHQNMVKWMLNRGTFVGPDHKIYSVDSEGQAKKLASNFINDQVDAADKAAEAANKQAEAATAKPEAASKPTKAPTQPQVAAPKNKLPDYISENRGRWFTPDESMARTYARGGNINAVDVPADVAKQTNETRVQGRPEHILPDVWMNKARPLSEMGDVPNGMVRLFRGTPLPTTAPVSGKDGGLHPMGKGMTQDSPAVAKVAQEAELTPGQEPLVMVKEEKPADVAKLAQPPTQVKPEELAAVGTKDEESDRTILQPSDSVLQNERMAAEGAPELATKLSEISASVPGARFDRMRPQKNLGRITEKEDADKPPATIADYSAAQIAADSPQAKDLLIQELHKNFKVLSVEDKFTSGDKDLQGYPSVKVQVQLSNGHTSEVQIVPTEMQEVADHAHHFYSEGRKADVAGDTKKRDEMWAQSEKINTDALDKAKESWAKQGWEEAPPPPKGFTLEPDRRYDIATRKHIDGMTPTEQRQEIEALRSERLVSTKTALPNYNAFQEASAEQNPIVGYADLDDFKDANTALGHKGVDSVMLPRIGEIIRAAAAKENVLPFHRSGDEFLFRAKEAGAIGRVVDAVNEQLKQEVFKSGDEEQKGAGFSYGTGHDEDSAEKAADPDKERRKKAGLRKGIRDAGIPKRGTAGTVDTSLLRFDPRRFQYKLNVNEKGVTNALEGQKFNPKLSGEITVWQDPVDGNLYVINGHHRAQLAIDSGYPTMRTWHSDVDSAEQARAEGALQNIADGHGTTVDAAKYFRDSGVTPEMLKEEGVSLSAAKARDGLALANLDDRLFEKVATGKMSEGRGIAIGEATSDPAQQEAIVKLIDKREAQGKNVTEATVSELARFVTSSGSRTVEQGGLFGANQEIHSIALEKAEISAYIKNQIAKERRTFAAVATESKASALSQVQGQQIKAGENAKISQAAAQAEEAYNKLSSVAGPVNDVLEKAARELASGYHKPEEIKSRAYAAIREEVRKTLSGAGTAGDTGLQGAEEAGSSSKADSDQAVVSEENPDVRNTSARISPARQAIRARAAASSEQSDNDTTSPARIVPGGRSAYTGNETGLGEIEQLTESIAKQSSGKSLSARLRTGASIGERFANTRDAVASSLGRLKGGFAALVDAWKNPPKAGDYEKATGQWSGADQRSALDLHRFTKAIKEAVPNKLQREAISNWIEAGGDKTVLQYRAGRSEGRYKPGYEAALKLTDKEKTIAQNVMNLHDATLQEAINAGIVEGGVENYIQHIYADRPQFINRIRAEMNFNTLKTKPSFGKQRTLPTYFEAEQLGHNPKDKDVGYLTAVHERSLREALAARGYIKSLMGGKAADGRPLVATSWASAKEITEENKDGKSVNPSYLIKPNMKPGEDFADYRSIDHPSLRGWRWSGEAEGKPIFVQGDALVHPEIYQKLKNNLGTSALRRYEVSIGNKTIRPGSIALDTTAEIKHFVLSFSGFHQTTLGIHALEHKVGPVLMPQLDLNEPVQSKLVDHGLMVAHYDAMEAFGEGVSSGGLVTKTPGIGPAYRRYVDYLFLDYMPRLKMQMAKAAVERNRKRYPNLSEEQIFFLTASQANAAFGGLNYRLLGRNKTMQDTLRLLLMAPDFTEARARFAAQAGKRFGREQLAALILGAVVLYTVARIINQAGDHDPHWDKPFSVIHNHKEYKLRTIQGDLLDAAEDPKQFLRNRVSPPVSLMFKDDDSRYQPKDSSLADRLRQRADGTVPIPLQPWMRESQDTNADKALETLLKMIGVNQKNEPRSQWGTTPAEKLARKLASNHPDYRPYMTAEQLKDKDQQRAIRQAQEDAGEIERIPQLVHDFKFLSYQDASRVFEVATPEEQERLRSMLREKRTRALNKALLQRGKTGKEVPNYLYEDPQ